MNLTYCLSGRDDRAGFFVCRPVGARFTFIPWHLPFLCSVPFFILLSLFYRSFSIRLSQPENQGKMSVQLSALHSKVRKAVPDQRQSASYRFMPELRPVETTGIPLYGHPASLLLRHIPPSVRIFPFRADGVMGKR